MKSQNIWNISKHDSSKTNSSANEAVNDEVIISKSDVWAVSDWLTHVKQMCIPWTTELALCTLLNDEHLIHHCSNSCLSSAQASYHCQNWYVNCECQVQHCKKNMFKKYASQNIDFSMQNEQRTTARFPSYLHRCLSKPSTPSRWICLDNKFL